MVSYAELGTMIPGSGGEAQYLAQGFGPLMIFLFNWTSIVILKPGTVAILSLATAKYLLDMVKEIFSLPMSSELWSYIWFERALAIIVCFIVTLASSFSVKWSNRVQNALSFGKIIALGLIICSGIYYALFVEADTIKANLGEPFEGSQFKFGSIASALNNGLWAFEGWNNLNIVAGNLANPSVNLPLSIWISMVSVVCLYLLTLLGYFAVLDKAVIISATTVIGSSFGRKVFGVAGNIIMPFFIASSTFGSALSSMITSSEIIVLAATTGQLPKYFKKISPSFGTAARAYWMQGIISAVFVTGAGFDDLIFIYSFPTWIFYAACVIVLLKLRYTAPKLERPYKVWLSTPILFLASCLFLLCTSFWNKKVLVTISFGVVLLGVPLYYLFGLHGSSVEVAKNQ